MFDNLRNNCVEKIRLTCISAIFLFNHLCIGNNNNIKKDCNQLVVEYNEYNDYNECNGYSNTNLCENIINEQPCFTTQKCNVCSQNLTRHHKIYMLHDKSYCSVYCRNSSGDLKKYVD